MVLIILRRPSEQTTMPPTRSIDWDSFSSAIHSEAPSPREASSSGD
jgi:hypothetical protein